MQFAIMFTTFFAAAAMALPTNTTVANITVVDKSAGKTACNVACDVTCNSTVLALAQTLCLKKCKALCPST